MDDLNKMTDEEIHWKICKGRSCKECPIFLYGKKGTCHSAPRDVLIQTYYRLIAFYPAETDKEIDISDEEIFDLIKGEENVKE